MARTKAKLPGGARVTDYIGLGVVASAFPRATIDKVLQSTGKASQRQRGKWPTSGGEGSARAPANVRRPSSPSVSQQKGFL